MKKSLFIFSLLSVSLLADTSLGTPIGNSTTTLKIKKQQKRSALETKILSNSIVQSNSNHLTTRITPKKVKSDLKKKSQHYDKFYRNYESYYPRYYMTNHYYPSYENRYGNHHYSSQARMTTRHNEYHAPRAYNDNRLNSSLCAISSFIFALSPDNCNKNRTYSSHHYNDSRMSTREDLYNHHRSVSRMQIKH